MLSEEIKMGALLPIRGQGKAETKIPVFGLPEREGKGKLEVVKEDPKKGKGLVQ